MLLPNRFMQIHKKWTKIFCCVSSSPIRMLEFWKSHLGMTLLLTAVAGSHSRLGRFHSLGYSGSRLHLRRNYARIATVLLREGLLPAAITAVSIPHWLSTVVVLKLTVGIKTYQTYVKRDLAQWCVMHRSTSPPFKTARQWYCSPGMSHWGHRYKVLLDVCLNTMLTLTM